MGTPRETHALDASRTNLNRPRIAAIEAGGTKFVLSVGRSPDELRGSNRVVVPTRAPDATLRELTDWLRTEDAVGRIDAVGVASFGPLDLIGGRISTSTPKLDWRGVDWMAAISEALPGRIVALDTDTDAAAIAESRFGAARGCAASAYVTVGTGIGGGVIIDGRPVHGLMHPEIGHLRVPRVEGDDFVGCCPHHGDCLEGLASGPAIERRWGARPEELPQGHPAWRFEAHYLASLVVCLSATLCPERIVLGGGVLDSPGLLTATRLAVEASWNGYLPPMASADQISRIVVAPELGGDSGIIGAWALARDLLP
jgi:fructokinase